MSERDAPWLDDVVSLTIVAIVVLGLAGLIAALGYLLATGSVDAQITTDITVVGTIPIGHILLGVLGFVGWMVYVAFTDIYGRREVQQATEDMSEAADGVLGDDSDE